MKMISLLSALGPCKWAGCVARTATVLLLFLSLSKDAGSAKSSMGGKERLKTQALPGFSEEETRLPSSQQKSEKDSIQILISESVKNTRTLVAGPEKLAKSTQNVILPTELSTNSSYLETIVHNERPTAERLENNYDKVEFEGNSRDYYEAIKPTKTVSAQELKITQTKISKETGQGESEGVSMSQSGPLKKIKMLSFKRTKRGFGNPTEELADEQKSTSKRDSREDGKKKITEKNNFGKNYNQIEQTLRKIAKVTISEEKQQTSGPAVISNNFRESREEENRKASPDIQDIITGIVNILNGKATKQTDGTAGRPRPTGTRINNRGPPRISDVPPLDFDGPPSYRPLPPPPPKRVPPPYPFDIPPSITGIPLPPQPHSPPSKLPPHPFIDGVPIPKIVIPDEKVKPGNRPPEVQSEYDTISMSGPVNTHIPPIANSTKHANASLAPVKNSTLEKEKPQVENSTVIPTNNSTNSKPDKVKVTGQKIPSSSSNKNANKRVRPNPATRPSEKPVQIKTTTPGSTGEIKNKTTNSPKDENTQKLTTETPKPGQKDEKPVKEATNGTRTSSQSSVNVSANVSTVLNIKPITGAEVKKNKTGAPSVVPSATYEIHEEPTKHAETQVKEKIEEEYKVPILLEPSTGIGEATPVLETSILEISMLPTEQTKTPTTALNTQRPLMTGTSQVYKARPGIVLDDPEYKPGGHKRPVITARPIITAPPPHSHYGEIFDVTVHAVQGPEESSSGKPIIVPVNIDGIQVHNSQAKEVDVSVITKPEEGQNFVSIDGKRTYINLFGDVSSTKISPTTTQPTITGTGYAIPHKEPPAKHPGTGYRPPVSPSPPRRPYKRPSHPPVRIDTCIVGDETTCDSAQNEMCKTEDGVSSCHCRPGYNRRNHRDTCRRVISMVTSLRVDRLYDRKVKWQDSLRDPDSEEYQQLSYEASQAIESAMSMTPFSDDFINSRVNSIFTAKTQENGEPAVYVNVTIQLEENLDTVRPAVKHDIQRHLLRVIQRRNNNVGNSAVWVDASPGSILALQDVDECSSSELHDCHERAVCLNTFGSFRCQCPTGSRDPWVGNVHREGRYCETCSSEYCNNRGECIFERGQQVCHCSGSFYGAQCEIDGEVLGVAIGASVAAAIIIILTLICLCMWSRRWSREQKSAVGTGMGSPVFGYMATGPTVKTPSVGSPPYQVSIEDRIRWAQIADVMAKSNHYAQPEPVNTTRTSFGGYPTLPSHTMNMKGTLPLPTITPPVPLPRLTLANKQPMGTYGAHSQFGSIHQSNHGMRSSLETSSSEEDADRVDLLGRNFNVPRPKSRTSVANQSGIYYDVDFDRSDAYSKQNTIPLNTYTLNPQHQVRPYFR